MFHDLNGKLQKFQEVSFMGHPSWINKKDWRCGVICQDGMQNDIYTHEVLKGAEVSKPTVGGITMHHLSMIGSIPMSINQAPNGFQRFPTTIVRAKESKKTWWIILEFILTRMKNTSSLWVFCFRERDAWSAKYDLIAMTLGSWLLFCFRTVQSELRIRHAF